MNYLQVLIAEFLEHFEKLKGTRSFKVINVHQKLHESYKVITSSGCMIEIFCKEVTYQATYSEWWAMNKNITMYHAYCAVSNDADQVLKDKLSEDFIIAQLLHPFSHKASQKKAVIDSYIDLVLSKF